MNELISAIIAIYLCYGDEGQFFMKPVKLNQLLFHPKTPCLSFYQLPLKTHEDEEQLEVFFNDMMMQLASQGLQPIAELLQKSQPGIKKVITSQKNTPHGFFLSQDLQGFISLEDLFENYSIVGQSFHVRPLLEQVFLHPEFYILNVSLSDVNVYHSDFNHVEILKQYELEDMPKEEGLLLYSPRSMGLLPFKTRSAIKAIAKRVNNDLQNRPLPVVITGLEEIKKLFLSSFDYTSGIINMDFDFFEKSCSEIREKCRLFRPAVLDYYSSQFKLRLNRMLKSKNLLRELEVIVPAIIKDEVTTLILPLEKKLWGKIDLTSGEFEVHKKIQKKDLSVDILNEIAEEVIKNGGRIQFMNPHFFPENTDVLAITKGYL
jgi:hypothetical protein